MDLTTDRDDRSRRSSYDPWAFVLVGAVGVFLTVHVAVAYCRRVLGLELDALGRWFDVNSEANLPAWFATVLLFSCARSLWALSRTSAAGPRARWASRERALAAVFAYLSLDEMTQLHERANGRLSAVAELSPVLTFPWVVAAVPPTVVLALLLVPYLRALPRWVTLGFVGSGAVFVLGAVGVELLGALVWSGGGQATFLYAVVTALEEGLEMLGSVLFLITVDRFRRSLS